ncbi:calcium-binding protein [Streptomyces sp. RB110-1]|uniref:calcium-binding protein n=1 Tax=unclassified Streptomyces TaxID=2593676 RepID=UPI001901F9D1|nr:MULTISPECIES: calcium-binding protein [unclassified Streptomyces]MBK0376271.1 calcium-binding protein [Streptomyces sp. RB110-1]MBK0387355.1 calcium-binding protein [Streptomyces sp. RB110-2]
MRIRATVAAVTGALALSAFAVPAVQADEKPDAGLSVPSGAEIFGDAAGAPAAKARSARAPEVPVIKKVVVNGGKDIVVGTTAKKKFTVSITASSPSGIADGFAYLWHGHIDEVDGVLAPAQDRGNCKASSRTTSTCTVSITVDPRSDDLYTSSLAGTWNVAAGALSARQGKEDFIWNDYQAKARVQRASQITVNAAPEPVKKGKTLTVTGKLSRANWDTHTYKGYTGQPVKLQFRKKGSSTYTTVKTVKTNSTGNLKTTVKASVDGYWRYSFAGTSTTPAATAAGDFVDVK